MEDMMQSYTVQISEDQLCLIQAALKFTLNHNGSLVEEDRSEVDMIEGMIENLLEEKNVDIIHGFCY
jgi:hypothetical protein